MPQLALERDGAAALLRRYLYGKKRVSLSTPSASSYYHCDNLGSVSNLTSASGQAQWTYAYEPFGTTRTETQDDPGAPQNPLKFSGELLDPTGLYHLRVRQYDPAAGRFLQPDPVGQDVSTGALSKYAYAGDRPTVMVDPSGQPPNPPLNLKERFKLPARPSKSIHSVSQSRGRRRGCTLANLPVSTSGLAQGLSTTRGSSKTDWAGVLT